MDGRKCNEIKNKLKDEKLNRENENLIRDKSCSVVFLENTTFS